MKVSSFYLIGKLKDQSIKVHQLNEIVLLTVSIACRLISKNYAEFSINNPFISLRELAEDAVTPLFLPDSEGQLPICKSLANWNRDIKDEASANFFLFSVVKNRIEQESTKKLKLYDPFFAKILRSINNLVEKNIFHKSSWFGIIYLVLPNTEQIDEKPIEPGFIDKLPSHLFQGSTEVIICNVINYLNSEGLFSAVPLNDLIKKIKHVNASFFSQANSNTDNLFLEEKLDIQQITLESKNVVNKKVEDFYLPKGKLTLYEAEIFKKIIDEFSIDLQDGGISRGLYEYLFTHIPDLSKEEYYSKYQQPLDYLLRLLKKEISMRLNLLKD